MKRAFPKSPLSLHLIGGALFFLVLSLTGAKVPIPGEIMMQEGVFYRTEGLQLQKAGELARAASAFRQAIYVKPDYAEAHNDLGVVLESMGDLQEAEKCYKTALRFKPELGPAHSNLALLYEESDRVKQAAAHWAARVRLGPANDPWVLAAREKLAKYQLPVPETEQEKSQRKKDETRRLINAGKAHMEAKRWDSAIDSFEQALAIDPSQREAVRLLRSAKTRAAEADARRIRELEAAKGRVTKEAAGLKHGQDARKAELERNKEQTKQWKPIQSRSSSKESKAADKKAAAQKSKELEEARRITKEIARGRREEAIRQQKLEKQNARVEKPKTSWGWFGKKSEETTRKKAAARQLKQAEDARRKAEAAQRKAQQVEAKRQMQEAKKIEAEIARQSRVKPARPVAAVPAPQASVPPAIVPPAPAPVKVAPVKAAPVKVEPVRVEPQPVVISAQAEAIAREIAREKLKVRGKASDELSRRAVTAMREGLYRDAMEVYKQILILEPGNRSAQQGLERAEKALAKQLL